MSKFKKPDKDINFDLEEFLEERFEKYLEECDYSLFEDDDAIKEKSLAISEKPKESDFYDALMTLYVKDLEALTQGVAPTTYQIISGSGPAWFFEPMTRTFIKTERGSEIVVVPGKLDEHGRMLVRTTNTFLMIPREEILDLGYN